MQVLNIIVCTMETDKLAVKDGYNCGLGIIGGKWKVVILWLLSERPRRFGELKRELPNVSERILINQLREMARDGIIIRHDFQQVPPKVEYSITPVGLALNKALSSLLDWGLAHERRTASPQ